MVLGGKNLFMRDGGKVWTGARFLNSHCLLYRNWFKFTYSALLKVQGISANKCYIKGVSNVLFSLHFKCAIRRHYYEMRFKVLCEPRKHVILTYLFLTKAYGKLRTTPAPNSLKIMDKEAAFLDVIKFDAWKVRRLF